MNNINFEQIRLVFISTLSPVVGVLTPTMGFIYALVIMFAFNIWAEIAVPKAYVGKYPNDPIDQ